MFTKIHRYKVVGSDGSKVLPILEDSVGWLYIAKLPKDRENIWPSIEMIEDYLQVKLELVDSTEFKDMG